MRKLTAKENAELTYNMIQKLKTRKKKQNEAAVYDVVDRAVKRCTRK
ncbi:hypothetical protein [Clostridium tyrobutyricum]|nr:hypothetical protein [Clostridium tyrobutyricum]MBV4417137.1 hypothetical protein [Clostridium tyrobutyricum]